MKIFRFNMIEIVLAIGIAAFGIMGVVAMIPPALNANRDVAYDSFSDEAISKMKFLVKAMYVPNWDSMVNSNTYCPTSSTVSELEKKTQGNNVFADSPSQQLKDWNIFHTTAQNVFFLTSSDSTVKVHAVIWKQQVQKIPTVDDAPSYDYAAQIFIEISWPVNAVYANRQKRVISFEVYKP